MKGVIDLLNNIKKLIQPRILQILQFLLSLVLIFNLFIGELQLKTGLIMPDNLSYFPLIVNIIILCLLFLECLNQTPFIRMLFFIINITAILNFHQNIHFLNLIFSLYGILNVLVLIYDLFFKKKKDKTLPVGVYTNKQNNYQKFLSLLTLLLCSFLFYWWNDLLKLHWLIALIFIFILAIVFILFIFYIFNPFNQIFNKFQKDCLFDSFNQKIEELKTHNLHPDSYYYFCLIQTKYYFLVDKKQGLELFDKINCCESYKDLYQLVKIDYLYNKDKSEEALKTIQNLKKNVHYTKNIYTALYTLEDIKNVEQIFNTKQNYAFVNLMNTYYLMLYYFQRNDLRKASEYAKIIVHVNHDLHELNKKAKEILTICETSNYS